MTFPAPERTPHETARLAGEVLREAASALFTAENNYEAEAGLLAWMSQPFEDKTRWGLKVAPSVLATIYTTKPQGWVDLVAEVTSIASMWARSLPTQEEQ